MYKCHKDICDCEYLPIKNLLSEAKYFDTTNREFCNCVKKRSIYSREWDYEHLDHFSTLSAGINYSSSLLHKIINGDIQAPEILKDKINKIPKNHKGTFIELLKYFNNADLAKSIDRISIYINDSVENYTRGYIGFIDITPLDDICDAYIVPPYWMKPPNYYLTCSRTYIPETTLRYMENETDEIRCVPFVAIGGIRGEIGVCAQYAVRMALMSLNPLKAPTVPELNFVASQTILKGGIERKQKEGWAPEEIKQIIEDNKYGCFRYHLYTCENCGNTISNFTCNKCNQAIRLPYSLDPSIENIYAYVESGIPVILGIANTKYLPWWKDGDEPHALLAIGHSISDNDEIDALIVHDESRLPYQVLKEPLKDNKKLSDIIIEAIVPVPREVIIEYPLAKEMAYKAMSQFDLEPGDMYRPLLTDPHQVKRWLGENVQREHLAPFNLPKNVQNDFLTACMDRYLWIFEISRNADDSKEYLGDILISATQQAILGFIIKNEGIYAYRDKKFDPIIKSFDVDT